MHYIVDENCSKPLFSPTHSLWRLFLSSLWCSISWQSMHVPDRKIDGKLVSHWKNRCRRKLCNPKKKTKMYMWLWGCVHFDKFPIFAQWFKHEMKWCLKMAMMWSLHILIDISSNKSNNNKKLFQWYYHLSRPVQNCKQFRLSRAFIKRAVYVSCSSFCFLNFSHPALCENSRDETSPKFGHIYYLRSTFFPSCRLDKSKHSKRQFNTEMNGVLCANVSPSVWKLALP